MGKSNLKVSQENADRGWKEEDLFKLCVEKFKGLICLKSSVEDDRYRHIDFYLSNRMSVDVKAHKKINASDTEVSQKYTWVEILNVNGNFGWVDGWATHIAYSFTTHYKLFDREKLKQYILSKVDVNNFVIKDTSNPVPYQVYRRNTLKDKVVLVPIQDLIDNVPFLELERDESLLNNE